MSDKRPVVQHIVQSVPISELVPDDRNANRHTAGGMEQLSKGLQRHKFGRPVLADRNLRMIAGNGVLETVASLTGADANVILVRTTGDQMIVHVREDLDLDDLETRRMALEDNRIQEQNLDWDAEILHAFDGEGVDFEGLWSDDQLDILRSARFLPAAEGAMPEPATSPKKEEERVIEFSAEQWTTVRAAVDKLNAEQSNDGLELSPADALVILCASFMDLPDVEAPA